MNPVVQLQRRFFKTQFFKGLLKNYLYQDDSLVVSKQTALDQVEKAVKEQVPDLVSKQVQEEIQKVDTLRKNEAMRYRVPYNINGRVDPDRKPGADVPFSYLRRMATIYPIARACINRRIRQITQLEWDITTVDDVEGEEGYDAQIATVKEFFKHPMGNKTRMREMLTMIVDDTLTVDAVCFELQRTRGGRFMNLIPVDPTTIALRVTPTGATPEPPEDAYTQFIQGREIASFTTDEMIYEMMGSRTYSPYGLAPLESLILQTEAAVRGTLYNLNYFRENNVPEGFITLPEEIASSKERVEEWQLWFDSMVAGDPRFTHRLKILPGGSEYEPAKKPEDMSFEKFELWLLQQTCAVFDVPPQDIGITYQVNKATSESQADLSRERGLIPLGNFVKEILDHLIQEEFELPQLQFIWRNINPVDRKEEIEIAAKEISQGSLSVDEYRIQQGLEPLGLNAYIVVGNELIMVDDIVSGKYAEQKQQLAEGKLQQQQDQQNKQQGNQSKDKPNDMTDEDKEKLEIVELKKWRRCIYKDLDENKPLRADFASEVIRPEIKQEIKEGLAKIGSKLQVKLLFDSYIDPDLRASMTLLKYASNLRKLEYDAPTAHPLA